MFRIAISRLAILVSALINLTSCNKGSDPESSPLLKSYNYNFGYHSGVLTITGSSILDSGMFTLVDAHKSSVDTSYGNYIMLAKNDELVGVSKDFNTVIFTLHKDLDSGYLLDERAIKLSAR